MGSAASLPVENILPVLLKTLGEHANLVLMAPPGAGKTTLVPPFILAHEPDWLAGKKIILVEPRRVAVRGAAFYMARQRHEKPGGVIGYCTRLDQALSGQTRIEVLTEGMILRRLLANPLLDDVGIIIFDEVHERSLDCDTALALCLDLQKNFRPELRLVAMSATLDTSLFTDILQAPLLESPGRSYPVSIVYGHDLAEWRDLPKACAQIIPQAWEEGEGSILVFLPGIGEIKRTASLLDRALPVCLLYGEQSPEEQQKVLDPDQGRHIVLATSIAETSVTVPGVRVVVDGGWRRSPERDAVTGLPVLRTHRISRSTAEQRAGRAGRQGPGKVFRLWSEATQRRLAVQDSPEIREADLSAMRLILAAWQDVMGTRPDELAFIEHPPSGPLAAARELLVSLGALDSEGHLTSLGKRMSEMGAHPRLAAMLCSSRNEAEKLTACCLVALLEERDPYSRVEDRKNITSDIRQRLFLFTRGDARVPSFLADHLKRMAVRYARRLGLKQADFSRIDEKVVPFLIAAGFPDRLAQQSGAQGRYRLASGGSAHIPVTDLLSREAWLIAVGVHKKRSHEITLAVPLQADSLPYPLQNNVMEQRELTCDPQTGRIWTRQRVRLGAVILQDRNIPAEAEECARFLAERVKNEMTLLNWTDQARQLQARMILARRLLKPDWPDVSDEALSGNGDWLAPWLAGLNKLSQLKEPDMVQILRGFLSYEDGLFLDKNFPSHLTLKGRHCLIDYTGVVPVISARAQFFYGLKTLPVLAQGKIGLQAVLLSPAGRPQAVTADLATFWKQGWLDLRKDMKGRYPKHDWPEDPS
ncbi:ATP-dependent helicase HrpB [Acetobacteraceae bacterium ESL0709]|nr:ATP-dependent helicase HrpB [Acetobacteraceae bacterium ESL0697]MDF7678806.1 ATP-dependent helicase HrpB [Acetobacteraceae bacterium ESL0709]